MTPKVPCKACKDRVIYCHSTCKKYNAYKKQMYDIQKRNRDEHEQIDFEVNLTKKLKRK